MSRRGISIVETLIAAVLLSVTALGVVYLLNLMERQKVEYQVRKLVSDIQYAKSLAYQNGSSKVLFLKNCSSGVDCYRIESGSLKVERLLDRGITLSSEETIEFTSSLLPKEAGNVTLETPSGRYVVRWDNLSGNVRWERE